MQSEIMILRAPWTKSCLNFCSVQWPADRLALSRHVQVKWQYISKPAPWGLIFWILIRIFRRTIQHICKHIGSYWKYFCLFICVQTNHIAIFFSPCAPYMRRWTGSPFGLYNGLSPARHQASIWTKDDSHQSRRQRQSSVNKASKLRTVYWRHCTEIYRL